MTPGSAEQFDLELPTPSAGRVAPDVLVRAAPAIPTPAFVTYWGFAAERQRVFFRRLAGEPPPWTADPILDRFKFTNAYRASDRVSQFLIRRVIYGGPTEPEDQFFRTILFKLFNRISTWELLEAGVGGISWRNYEFEAYDRILSRAFSGGDQIYSAAYIIPSPRGFGFKRKHRNHLKLLEEMMARDLPDKLARTRRMQDGFDILRAIPSIGDFLAYQFITDLNYGTLTDYSESEFVVPGPGALDGIRKCFSDLGGLNEVDAIKFMADEQETFFEVLGLEFPSLWGRRLQLIDCQNLFCEVDKYSRVAHPDIQGISGRTRIKQKFRATGPPVMPWYPPKWGINDRIDSQTIRGQT